MGYIRIGWRAGVFAHLFTLPCPYPVGDQYSRHENHLYVHCPGVGQVARGLRTPNQLLECTEYQVLYSNCTTVLSVLLLCTCILYCTVLLYYCTVPGTINTVLYYCTVLYCAIRYHCCTVLYCTGRYYCITALLCTVLYCTVVYYRATAVVLYCTLYCCAVPLYYCTVLYVLAV